MDSSKWRMDLDQCHLRSMACLNHKHGFQCDCFDEFMSEAINPGHFFTINELE
jgi:hypothetical protein